MKYLIRNIWLLFFILICSCKNDANLRGNINLKASFPDTFSFSPAGLRVINSFIDKKAGTVSMLYGNSLAVQKAIGLNKDLTGGELFTLVTWRQQPDGHWFGANIPGDLQSVEVVKSNLNGSDVVMDYRRYHGKTLVPDADTLDYSGRIKFILGQRPSVMP